jgi:hypothetical protein
MRSSTLLLVLAFTSPVAAQQPAQPSGEFTVGQKVLFEDVFNRYGGGMVSGTVVEVLDISCNCDRFKVRVDVPVNPAFQIQGFSASRLRPAGQ